ncbi:CvfB family protein [Anaerophilus nitritogenes]|uniref:CvfB family protein n=1 Tax=Anaerophilus nitritogenes TaxID=2498136 RepID=UPI00101C7D24|nr:S1-like domain-containing RNA-binding protein [Anaerophilus nitritogenes]
MIELGKIQILKVIRSTSIGIYLNQTENEENDDILLPQKQVPKDIKVGDEIEVFVYRDSEDRMIATTKKPKITLGELEKLKVIETTQIGAFLDWGLEKDLFLPFKEQTNKVQVGRSYLVSLYTDKSDRLCATMDVYKLLDDQSTYKENDQVTGTIYKVKKEIGAFVAVDLKYHGLIPQNEFYGDYMCGDEVEARVVKVKEDGKLDLSLRKKAYKQMDEDVHIILDQLDRSMGVLHLNDKTSPTRIKEELNMSKNAFKRAIGRLLKEGKIKFTDEGIEKI